MKRAISAVLSIGLFFCVFSVLASAEEEPDWRTEYLDYIVDDYYALNKDEKEMTTYHVMYIASSGIPYIYVSRGYTAGGSVFCYVDGNKVVTERIGNINFEYIEMSDAYFMSGGKMGAYFDSVYVVEDSGVVQLGAGSYGGEYGTILEDDTGKNPVNTYTWNGKEVTREEYRREYYGLRDKYLMPKDEIIVVDGYGYGDGGYSYDEIIAWFMEQETSETVISGLYADTAMGSTMSQINFDGQNRSFILLLNLWYDWEIAGGIYSVDENGVIECKPDRLISRCYENNKVTDSEKLFSIHFLISGDEIVPVEEGLCEGQAYYRISDGFSVIPDSGTGTVTGDAVRVRSGPGTDYTILTALDSGNQVTITGNSGDWYRIECIDKNGALFWGFMRSDYITRNK